MSHRITSAQYRFSVWLLERLKREAKGFVSWGTIGLTAEAQLPQTEMSDRPCEPNCVSADSSRSPCCQRRRFVQRACSWEYCCIAAPCNWCSGIKDLCGILWNSEKATNRSECGIYHMWKNRRGFSKILIIIIVSYFDHADDNRV